MKKIVFGTLAATAVAALALGVAQADDRGAGPMGGMERPTFGELDSDGDGNITIAEVKARAAARFADNDADGDGKLTVEELTACGGTCGPRHGPDGGMARCGRRRGA